MENQEHSRVGCISISRNNSHLICLCIYDQLSLSVKAYEFTDSLNLTILAQQLKINSVTTLLVPQDLFKKNKMLLSEKQTINFIETPRSLYNRNTGVSYLQQIQKNKNLNVSNSDYKFFSITALAVLVSFCIEKKSMALNTHFKSVKFMNLENKVFIPLKSIKDLELIENGNKKGHSLFSIIKGTKTKIGTQLLKRNLMEPCYDMVEIKKRQKFVMFCMKNQEFATMIEIALHGIIDLGWFLENVKDFDYLEDKKVVKCCIEACSVVYSIENLIIIIEKNEYFKNNEIIGELHSKLIGLNIDDTKLKLRDFFNQNLFTSKSSITLDVYLNTMLSGINPLLDLTRQIFTENINDMESYINENFSEKTASCIDDEGKYVLKTNDPVLVQALIRKKEDACLLSEDQTNNDEYTENLSKSGKVPDLLFLYCKSGYAFFTTVEIQHMNSLISDSSKKIIEISAAMCKIILDDLYDEIILIGTIYESIALVDMLQSFYLFGTRNETVIPVFSDTFICTETYNIFLRNNNPVKNSVYASDFMNFNIITGENMGGKTTYARSLVYTVILAQIGCPVNCKYASVKLFKNILTRLSNGDDLSQNLSTFEVELVDAKMILDYACDSSLIILDELGRGTNYFDGYSFALTISDFLIEKKSYVYLITHFKEIIDKLELYKTVNVIKCNDYKISSGLYLSSNGIASAARYLPKNYIDDARIYKRKLIKMFGKNEVNFNNTIKETAVMILNCKTTEEKILLKRKLSNKK